MNKSNSVFSMLEEDILQSNVNHQLQTLLIQNLNKLKTTNLNIMIVGATGAGKSSTINALFHMDIAKVGVGCSPQTASISSYTLHNLTLWDTAGLGDGYANDKLHAKAIRNKLNETTTDGELLIDLVLVIIDGSTRDLGTATQLINELVIPSLGDKSNERILVAINQADVAMKGANAWDRKLNSPTPESARFLNEKIASLKLRVFEATALAIEPIYYVAGYHDGEQQQLPYNLSKLLFLIVEHTPKNKRVILADSTLSTKTSTWLDDDRLSNYNQRTRDSLWEGIVDSIHNGADLGANIGLAFGRAGGAIGTLIGGAIGALRGLFR